MMKCKELETHAIAFLDGKLALSERAAVEAHLAACPACRERIQGFSSVMGLLGDWPAIQPSPFFQTRLAARLQAEPTSQSWWQSLWQM
jgi:anti-sigma factor RsiW